MKIKVDKEEYENLLNRVKELEEYRKTEQAKETIKEESKRPFISPTKDINEFQEKVWKDINKIWF